MKIVLDAIRVCARYKPKFGQGNKGEGLTLEQFQELHREDALHRSRANARGSPGPRRAAPHHGAHGANARDAPTHGTRWGRHPALGTSWPSCARLGSLSRARRLPGRRAGLPSEPVPRLLSESPAPREAGDSPGAAAATPRARCSSDRPRDTLHRGPPDGPSCAPPAPSTRTREPAPRACDLPAPERRAHHLAPVLRRVGGTSLCHRDTSSAQWSGVHESGATPGTCRTGAGPRRRGAERRVGAPCRRCSRPEGASSCAASANDEVPRP